MDNHNSPQAYPRASVPVDEARFRADIEPNQTIPPFHADKQMDEDQAVGPGGLSMGAYYQIVNVVTEAATLAVIRAMQQIRVVGPTPSGGAPSVVPNDPSSDRNESEPGLEPFECPPVKKRVPRTNQDKLVDEAMRKFLESKGVLVKGDYFPIAPEDRLVDAFESHGIGGPDLNAPCVCMTWSFRGKWNKEVVEILTVGFISEVKAGTYEHIQHTWSQMTEDNVRKRCQKRLYRVHYMCRKRGMRSRSESDKINRMQQRQQDTYLRRRRIYDLNCHRDPDTWKQVGLLFDALGTWGTSDDETDCKSERTNPDPRFKTLRRVDLNFLSPAIAEVWAAVESYPSSFCPSRGNRSFKRISKAKSVNKQRMPLEGLPINFYNPQWLEGCPRAFRKRARADVPLPALVPYMATVH